MIKGDRTEHPPREEVEQAHEILHNGDVTLSRYIFVAKFVDGVVVRMPANIRYDALSEAIELIRCKWFARSAYRRRTGKTPPAFAKAHFAIGPASHRAVIKYYSAAELVDDNNDANNDANNDVDKPTSFSIAALDEALTLVKSAGFRVFSKPRKREQSKKQPVLNAIGKPFSSQHSFNYRMTHKPPRLPRRRFSLRKRDLRNIRFEQG
jgi:hypothetical protein